MNNNRKVIYNACMNQTAEQLTRKLAAQLSQNQLRICTAESCTGGLIAKTFTDLAGSSDWFERGFVTYSNEAKMEMLGVSADTLNQYGAVSQQTVSEMVTGALQHSRAQVAVAVTGIAGPGGGNAEKPVGSVWFGFAWAGQVICQKQLFDGDREQVRQQSLVYALTRLVEITA